jgi:hypothetical protein
MTNLVRNLAAATLLAAGISSIASVASAAPVADALAIKNAVPATVETVQWRRRGWGGVGAGLVAGAIIGGALASPYYGYGPAPYYYAPPPPPVYYGAPAAVYGAPPAVYGAPPAVYGGAPVAGDAVAYCMQRFRSYDPRSGTYLGFDGLRHPCP